MVVAPEERLYDHLPIIFLARVPTSVVLPGIPRQRFGAGASRRIAVIIDDGNNTPYPDRVEDKNGNPLPLNFD